MNTNQLGTFIIRVVLGLTFAIHGFVKFQGGIVNTAGWFESIGIPGFVAYLVAIIELVGGIALIVGLGSRWVSAIMVVIMIGATLIVKLSVGFLGNGQMAGWELDLALMVMALHLAFSGSSTLSLDSLFGLSKKEETTV